MNYTLIIIVLVVITIILGFLCLKQRNTLKQAQIREKAVLEKTNILEAERKAKEETERKAKEEAERRAKEEAERKAMEEAERRAKEEAERSAKEEAERKAEQSEITDSIFNYEKRDSDQFFAHLNENQKRAVLATEGRVKIVAGAGSGKTRVLANRFAYLVEELGVNPSHILCITFTNKAAQEMKSRIGKLVKAHNVNDFICTIHGFCVKFLRKEIYRIGYPKSFLVLDEEDSKDLAKQVMQEQGLDKTDITVKQFLSAISFNKANIPYVGPYIVPGVNISDEEKKDDFVKYLELQKKYYALDFNDLIQFTIYILENFDEARETWQQNFNYVQVDEAQDCNRSDWKIISLLSSYYGNLFIVGDPDQAIYEWRGSLVDSFVKFKAETEIILNENYRSTPNILNVANSIIVNNQNRIKKNLITQKPNEKIVVHSHTKSESEEGDWIAAQIKGIVKQGYSYSDIAILYRASYLSRYVEQSLLKKAVPYTVWGGVRFFERKEIKDCLSYLRLVDSGDDIAFKRIVNVPSRRFGKVTMDKLIDLAETEHTSLYDTLKNHLSDKVFNKVEFSDFISLIESTREKVDVISISDLLEYILVNSGLKELYRVDADEERLENINELINSIKYYESVNIHEEVTLNKYLQDMALYTNADYKEDNSSVKLMTIHQSKGLEFPFVFIVGLTEGVFPSHRSIREYKKRGLEEERRLMYVAVTRAEKMLFLTESEGFNMSTQTDKCPSRFIYEITDGLIKVDGKLDPILFNCTKSLVQSLKNEIEEINASHEVFVPGIMVKHGKFGIGRVLTVNEKDNSYKIQFADIARFVTGNSISLAELDEQSKREWCEKLDNAERLSNLKQKVYQDWQVDDIVEAKGELFVVCKVYEKGYTLCSLKTDKKTDVSDISKYSFLFRPQNDSFYLLKSGFRQDDSYFYVKNYHFHKNELFLNGIGSDLGMHQELTSYYLRQLFEVKESDFLAHCPNQEAFEEYRREKD